LAPVIFLRDSQLKFEREGNVRCASLIAAVWDFAGFAEDFSIACVRGQRTGPLDFLG
jgi:hypothetical protein